MPAFILINQLWVSDNVNIRLKIKKDITFNCKLTFLDFFDNTDLKNIMFWAGGKKGKDMFFLKSVSDSSVEIPQLPLPVTIEISDKNKTKVLTLAEKKHYEKYNNSKYMLTSFIQRACNKESKNEIIFCIYTKINN